MKNDYISSELLDIFNELSFKDKWKKVLSGLKCKKDSGEYKFARLQIIRLSAPIISLISVLIAIILLFIAGMINNDEIKTYDIIMHEPEKFKEELDVKQEIIEKTEEVKTEITEIGTISEVNVKTEIPNNSISENIPSLMAYDTVCITKSPILFKGIYSGNRSPGGIKGSLNKYGAPIGSEDAVYRAMRWLKTVQNSDGSWNSTKPAMTGLALLVYLAHGETINSEEFGPTIEKAIYYLLGSIGNDGIFKNSDQHEYS